MPTQTSMVASGGANGSGAAGSFSARSLVVTSGGGIGGGAAICVKTKPQIAVKMTVMKAALSMPVPFNMINGHFKSTVGASLAASTDSVKAQLPLLTATITGRINVNATIGATLTLAKSALTGGIYAITATLPHAHAALVGQPGSAGAVNAKLTIVQASVAAKAGMVGSINADLTAMRAALVGANGLIATINAQLTKLDAAVIAHSGASASIRANLTAITAELNAGFGAVGTVDARLPTLNAALMVLAQATAQQLVMVVNTHTNAVSTYEDYPFNSFCLINGVYYGAGPSGLCVLEAGDTDMGAPIDAGFSFGLLDFKEGRQKHMSDAYMTLRTAGDLTLRVTVDEAAQYAPVSLTMAARPTAGFIQRRVNIPKGLRGKTWQFELNNVAGADFDFGQLGLNVAVSQRRL